MSAPQMRFSQSREPRSKSQYNSLVACNRQRLTARASDNKSQSWRKENDIGKVNPQV